MEECVNWIVIETFQERYSFETYLRLHINTTLDDICKEYGIEDDDLQKTLGEDKYKVDYSKHRDIDTKWSNPELDGLPLKAIHLESLLIVSLDEFYKDESACFVWGNTNSKFGLIDLDERGTVV